MSTYEHNIPQAFLNFLEEGIPVSSYLHNTATIETAMQIFNTGFQFVNYLENSTDPINTKDHIIIKYFFNTRKAYGAYTLVIQIPNYIIEYCNNLVKNSDIHFYELIGELQEIQNDDEAIFLLPNQFIKGYYNIKKDDILRNPRFCTDYNLKQIDEKFKILTSK